MSKLSEQLSALPAHEPPAGGWDALQHRRQAQRRHTRRAAAGFALAASVLLTAGMLLWQPAPLQESAAEPADLVQLKARSRQLEQVLAEVRPQAVRWDRQLTRTASSLQDRLAVVDLQLNYTDEAGAEERLWQNRVDLMDQLIQTHEQAAQPASARPGNNHRNNEEFAI